MKKLAVLFGLVMALAVTLSGSANDIVLSELTKVIASDAEAFDEFGFSVAISGGTAVVGAFLDDDGGSNSGSVYIFQDTSALGDWSAFTERKLVASDAAPGDMFGWSVAIGEGTIVVGGRLRDDAGTSSGAAHVIRRGLCLYRHQCHRRLELVRRE